MRIDDKKKNDDRMKKYNITLTEKQEKYQHYYKVNWQIWISYTRRKSSAIEEAEFTYAPLGKVFEKQRKKQLNALKSLDFSNKINELKQIERIFPQNHMNYLITYWLTKRNERITNFIKSDHRPTNHRPTDHRPLTRRSTDHQPADSPTQ